MGAINEVAEKIEHAAHEAHEGHGGGGGHGDAHGGKSITRYVGITMAVLGVLLALCSALVGAERTELVQTMVRQSNAYAEYQTASTKYRMMMTQLEQTYAVAPSRKLTVELDGKLGALPMPAEQVPLANLHREIFKDLSVLLTPRKVEVERFLKNVARYGEERKVAKEWAESYDGEVEGHAEGAEEYEKAQLLAEVGIVIASIALLLSSRAIWIVALLLLGGASTVAGKTYLHMRSEIHEAHEHIKVAQERYATMREVKNAQGKRVVEAEDEEMMSTIRERFGVAESDKPTGEAAEPAKAEPAKAEPAKAEPAKAEPAKAEPAKAEPAKKP